MSQEMPQETVDVFEELVVQTVLKEALWFIIGALAFFLLLNFIAYFFKAMGLYTIAKRRGVRCPWLAWIPVANQWTLGSIHDEYKWMQSGDYTKMRITLLVFAILETVGGVLGEYVWNTSDELGLTLLFLLFSTPVAIFGLVAFILQCKAYYSLYRSCKPKRAVLFMVLSVLTPATPFLIFACRKHDDGLY